MLRLSTKTILYLITTLLVLVIGSTFFLAYNLYSSKLPKLNLKPTSTPSPTSEFQLNINWISYVNPRIGISLKHPENHPPQEAYTPDPSSKSGDLVLTNQPNFNLNNLEPCPQVTTNQQEFCLLNQHTPLEDTVVANKPAKKFAIFTSEDNSIYLVYQIQTVPTIEIAYPVDGIMLEETFNQIIESVEFTQEE